MAKLYFNKDIITDSDKCLHWCLTGDEGISFDDIQSFLDWAPAEDNTIQIEIHSCGGVCDEAYAMYDALRATGKEISCNVAGQCASSATIILLSAPLERRTMNEHAQILIHSPYFPGGISGDMNQTKLRQYADSLDNEKNKMLDLYVERTGKDRIALETQMNLDDWFGGDKAVELGFVSHVIQPASAVKKDVPIINNKKQEKEMGKEEKPTIAAAFRSLGIALGVVKDEPAAVNMVITTVTGVELNVERETGDIQVGDLASPDGEFVLEDGRQVTVENGVITEIKEEVPDTSMEALKEENEKLKAEIATLKPSAKTEEEAKVLAYVEKAGGIEALKKIQSTYTPAKRTEAFKADPDKKPVSMVEKKLAEARERNKTRLANRK